MQNIRRTTRWMTAGGLAAALAVGGAAVAQDPALATGVGAGQQAQAPGDPMHRHDGKSGRHSMQGMQGMQGMHKGMHMGMGMGGGMGLRDLRGLDLNDAQREQIRALTQESRENSVARFRELREIHRQLEDSIRANGFDEADARARIQSATPLLTELMLEQLRTRAAVLELLTPEQRAQLDAKRAERKQRFEERMNRAGKKSGS